MIRDHVCCPREKFVEALEFHGCETWGLTKSISSYIFPREWYSNLPNFKSSYNGSSNGLIWITLFFGYTTDRDYIQFVGNPVLQQWVEIRPPLYLDRPSLSCLVTRVENGVVLDFKAVWLDCESRIGLCANVYSSETGKWTYNMPLQCSRPIANAFTDHPVAMSLNGTLYLCECERFGVNSGYIVAHDFYASGPGADQCQVIPLPDNPDKDYYRRALTTSGGDVMFIEILSQGQRLKLWKLENNECTSDSGDMWKLSWEINSVSFGYGGGDYFPMAMNPFDTDLSYLWSEEQRCLVSFNLRTHEFIVQRETESCLVNTYMFKEYVEDIIHCISDYVVMIPQFVLPRWMESVPGPRTDITAFLLHFDIAVLYPFR
ncbi:unnamed protein product [Arabis nemorensis]|uniref:F-box protein At3g26010-like beta-propeller domain-containing protein n=1 Tax=Arabis nemorensis TaxID=586526 RepID=A0A565BWP0_9BRAS|nr:unnamed protein product [Arabis nemorensis]